MPDQTAAHSGPIPMTSPVAPADTLGRGYVRSGGGV
jgi:hypothetical protein